MRRSQAMAPDDVEPGPRLTLWQRLVRRRMLRMAGKRSDEPLAPEDWEAYFKLNAHTAVRAGQRVFRTLPTDPRCAICGAPFAGLGSRFVRPLGYRPSRKNPHLCETCVELSPPGGMTMEIGVLFADIRGFTGLSEAADPEHVSVLLRRFYASTEEVLFPQALIDKLIGDEVMALYIPMFGRMEDPALVMFDHACELLASVGSGGTGGPVLEVGIGLDFGEAFVGNIGKRSLYDFTAVGDVVNTASRLQGQAGGGEILLSSRLADRLDETPGERVELAVKGKAQPVVAYRISANPGARGTN